MPEVSEAFLQNMLTTLTESAAAMRSSANSMELVTEELKAQRAAIEKLDQDAVEGRDDAVEELKRHIDRGWDERDRWLRKTVSLFGTAMVLATLLGVPLGRVISAFFGIK